MKKIKNDEQIAGKEQELEELKGTYYKLMELQRKALALKGIE